MKKSIKLGLIALIGLTLSSCSLLEGVLGSSGLGGLMGGGNASSSKEEIPDSSVYGEGGESERLTVDADIPNGTYVVFPKNVPEGYHPEYTVYKSASTQITNVYWGDEFETTSMCELKPGQVVVAKYCSFQNVNSNPEVGELKNGVFEVGRHFQIKKEVLKIRGIGSTSGRYCLYSELNNLGHYTHKNLESNQITNLVNPDEVVSIPYVANGVYVELDDAEIVVES